MIKIIFIITLLAFSCVFGGEKSDQGGNVSVISNSSLGQGEYEQSNKSAVGKPVKIRVFYKAKSKPPSNNWLVELLGEGDKILKPHKSPRQIWLVGFNHYLSTMEEGNKYVIDGILVEDQGFYSALVVYVRNFTKISEQDADGKGDKRR